MANHPNRSNEAKKQRARLNVLAYSLFPGTVLRRTDAFIGDLWRDLQELSPNNREQLLDAMEMAHTNKQILEGTKT